MDTQILSFVLNMLQTLAIVLSLGALIYQLKRFNQSLRQEGHTRLADYFLRMSELLLHNKVLANQFYRYNTDYLKLSDDQKSLYEYLGMICIFYEGIYVVYHLDGVDQKVWEGCERWLVSAILPLDLFECYWRNERLSYHADFCKYVDEKLKRKSINVEKGSDS